MDGVKLTDREIYIVLNFQHCHYGQKKSPVIHDLYCSLQYGLEKCVTYI